AEQKVPPPFQLPTTAPVRDTVLAPVLAGRSVPRGVLAVRGLLRAAVPRKPHDAPASTPLRTPRPPPSARSARAPHPGIVLIAVYARNRSILRRNLEEAALDRHPLHAGDMTFDKTPMQPH